MITRQSKKHTTQKHKIFFRVRKCETVALNYLTICTLHSFNLPFLKHEFEIPKAELLLNKIIKTKSLQLNLR